MSELEKKTIDTSPEGESQDIQADVDEIMKKYDRESNVRIWEGIPKIVVQCSLAAFSLFLMWMNLFANWSETVRRPLFLGLVILFVFIVFPMRKKQTQKVNGIPIYDIILAIAGSGAYFYFVINEKDLMLRATRITQLEIVLGIIGALILFECCRRVVGLPILCVATCFIIYAFSTGKTVKRVVYDLFYTTTGIIGTPIGVCSTYIALFIVFGAFLEATGISNFFISCANALCGFASGGPAKVAVVSSALCGMVSGSSVGNTVTTGSVTIPMMKRTGYPPEFAGAVEAASSTGGQIMPPIMGAAAFLMAEMVGVPYSNIIIRAILPAILYFAGIFLQVHLRAKRLGLKGIPRAELPKWKELWPKLYLLLPLVILVAMIMNGRTMPRAAIIATVLCVVVSAWEQLKTKKEKIFGISGLGVVAVCLFGIQTFLEPNKQLKPMAIVVVVALFALFFWKRDLGEMTFRALENGARNCLSIGIACGVAGIIAGVVTMTGLGQIFISAIVGVANGHLIIALLLTMVTCIILGMGVPTTANYIIMATTCAPILVTGMGMDAIAANMFVFYFGIVADITPPVALAAYAGSAIAKSNPMKTAIQATKLAIAAFLIPYIFALNPAMLFIDTNIIEVIQVIVTSVIGITGVAAGIEGYLMGKMNWIERPIAIAGGLLMLYPGTISDAIGICLIVVVGVLQVMRHKKPQAA